MSAAAARRRKQLAAKKAAQQTSSDSDETPLISRLTTLLQEKEESSAYEALQLAQSQVRRLVKLGKAVEGADLAYSISLQFLSHGYVSVASQLLALLAEVLVENAVETTDVWVTNISTIDTAYKTAIEDMKSSQPEEFDRLMRLHHQFLKKIVKWTSECGPLRFGDLQCHALLAEQCWALSSSASSTTTSTTEVDEEDEYGREALRAEGVAHAALAEVPLRIGEFLNTLPPPSESQQKMGRGGGTAAERDCLLTRAILAFVAMENLRDANSLVRYYMENMEGGAKNHKKLAKSYMNKNDGMAPSHLIFCCMLLRVCEKDRAGPLFQWLLRSFAADLNKMRPDVKGYTTKIGRVYFGIQPPPNMLNMMENMMAMMAGGGMMAPGMQGMM